MTTEAQLISQRRGELQKAKLPSKKHAAPVKQPRLAACETGELPRAKRTTASQVRKALNRAIARKTPTSVMDVAFSLGLKNPSRLHRRFPALCRALTARRRHLARRPGRKAALKRLRSKKPSSRSPQPEAILRSALLEEPAPPLKKVAARITLHKTLLRQRFPELWKSIRSRFVEQQRIRQSERRLILNKQVRIIVTNLVAQSIHPSPPLVRSKLERCPLRSLGLITNAIREVLATFSC